MTIETMRDRFYATLGSLLDSDDRFVVVLAEIGRGQLASIIARHPERVINVGIREQLMVSVAAGLAHVGFRPVVHSYAPFAVERPFEQLKLDLGHQGLGAIVVSAGASYDWAAGGRTHQAPEDVALVAALPGWEIHVPGHPSEVEPLLRSAARANGPVYIRLAAQMNTLTPSTPVVRRGSRGTVIAVGPMLQRVLAATVDLDVTVLYFATVRPLDVRLIRATLGTPALVLVEPYLEGTSAAPLADGLSDIPHRLMSIGVPLVEHRRYGVAAEHDAAHGLDARSLRERITHFLRSATAATGEAVSLPAVPVAGGALDPSA